MTTPGSLPATPPAAFYRLGAAVQADLPGTLIDSLPLQAPEGTRAWAVLYRSRAADGRTVPVSGLVLAPVAGPAGPAYPTIAWAHGTTGIADTCAPSRAGAEALGLPELARLARAGFLVTATDYEGLGTTGIHPYLVGASEGHSVLDSIRAAWAVSRTRPGPAAIIGISQGGHAGLWAAELAGRYAPDVRLVGTVAASPPIDLRALQRQVLGANRAASPVSWMEALLVISAWQEIYGLPTEGLLTGEGMRIVEGLRDECPDALPAPTVDPFRVDPATRSDWQAKLEENSPGHHPANAPVLVLAAEGDEQVPPATIAPGVDRLCAAGSVVELRWVPGDHAATITSAEGASLAFSWLQARFAGSAVTSSCP